ncbi:MAG: glycosyltransferase family 2 protein [Chloroflexota bacterium]
MKFSVIFFTRDRRDYLKKCIEKFIEQDYPDKEIIVVDNGSTDGTALMIKELFPDVKLIVLNENIGTEAFNLALKSAGGDIIWRTDDDSHPETPFEMSKVAQVFKYNPNIHIVAMEDLEYFNDNKPLEYHPYPVDKINVPPEGYPTYTFIGCGAALRKEVFEQVGGFWEFGFEELELSTRAILHGFNISYFPNIRFIHYTNKKQANFDRFVLMGNQFTRYNWKYFPIEYAVGRHILCSFMQFIFALGAGYGIGKAIIVVSQMCKVSLHTIKTERKPVKRSQVRTITLGQFEIVNYTRLFKHKIQRKIRSWRNK